MTTYYDSTCNCAACGAEIIHTGLMSTNTMGYPDLDLREAEMKRSTMHTWITECPECNCVQFPKGKTNFDLSFIQSGEYRSLIHALLPELANRFQRFAVGLLHQGDKDGAAYAYTCAAWDCDDYDFVEPAIAFRMKAADIYLAGDYTAECDKLSTGAQCVDLLRRSKQFFRAAAQADLLMQKLVDPSDGEEDAIKKVLIYQKSICEKGDAGCYTLGAALAQHAPAQSEDDSGGDSSRSKGEDDQDPGVLDDEPF
jgi:hypothetical protein